VPGFLGTRHRDVQQGPDRRVLDAPCAVILAEADSYGYAILQRVRELSGGRLEWTDGMLYPVLHRLERLGYVTARWDVAGSGRRRKYYRITSEGRTHLAEERKQWQAVDSTLRGIWSARIALLLEGVYSIFTYNKEAPRESAN